MSAELELKKENSQTAIFREQLETANQMAELVINSNYGKLFETLVPDEVNNLDEEGKPTRQIKVIKKEDIVTCILLGRQLGLDDIVAITFGRTLDKTAYFKAMKGKSLGLDTITSLQHVFVYEKVVDGQPTMVIGTDAAAISSTIIKGGITYEITVDFKVKKYYRDQRTRIFLGYDFDESWVIVNKGITVTELKAALDIKKYPVTEEVTLYSEAIFHRKGWPDLKETYSLLEATEAGLYKGIKFDGSEEKGKFAWNANPKRILTTRLISIGASRIGADLLNGVYTKEEVLELKSNDLEEDFTQVEVIKEDSK